MTGDGREKGENGVGTAKEARSWSLGFKEQAVAGEAAREASQA